MKLLITCLSCLICIQLFACSKDGNTDLAINPADTTTIPNSDTAKMKMTIGSVVFTATLSNNATAKAFKEKLPLTIDMTELNGNEKYFDLPDNLPANASNPGAIQAGDLMLYGSNTVVLFYKTFSTSYNYTKLARLDNPSGLAAALGSGNKTVTFEME